MSGYTGVPLKYSVGFGNDVIEAGMAPDFRARPDANDEFINDAGMKPLECAGCACPTVLLLLDLVDDSRNSPVEYNEGREAVAILDWEDT